MKPMTGDIHEAVLRIPAAVWLTRIENGGAARDPQIAKHRELRNMRRILKAELTPYVDALVENLCRELEKSAGPTFDMGQQEIAITMKIQPKGEHPRLPYYDSDVEGMHR